MNESELLKCHVDAHHHEFHQLLVRRVLCARAGVFNAKQLAEFHELAHQGPQNHAADSRDYK